MVVIDRSAQCWLDYLAERGEEAATDLYAYEREPNDWAVAIPGGLPEHLVYFFASGVVTGLIGTDPVAMRAGSLFWLPPRTPFRLRACDDSGPTLYRFRLATNAPCPHRYLVVHEAWPLRSAMDAIVLELGAALEFRAERLRAFLVVLFTGIFRESGADTQRRTPLSVDTRRRIEDYVDSHLGQRPTVAELAAAAGLSADYFSRKFRTTFGVAPKRWLVRRRVQHGMQRLDESDEAISVIARELGYQDVFVFSRQFKSVVGMSPQAWRTRFP